MATSAPASSTTRVSDRAHGIGLLVGVAAVTAWAVGNVMVRAAPMGGLRLAFCRMGAAAILYLVLLSFAGKRLTIQHLVKSAPAGITLGLCLALFFTAIKLTTIANAAVIGSMQPLIILLISSRYFGEKIGKWLTGMTFIAFAGAALVVFGSSGQPQWSLKGDMISAVAMLVFAAYLVLAKRGRRHVPAFEFQTAVWITGWLVLVPIALFDPANLVVPDALQWRWILLLVAVPGTGHLLMNWTHLRIRLSTASILTLAIPAISIVVAAVWLGEPVTKLQAVGISIVMVSLGLIIRHQSSKGSVAETRPKVPKRT
jgi:drug/metabolite transporter (DMT)-like permease